MKRYIQYIFVLIMLLMLSTLAFPQNAEVVGTITNEDVKMDGVTWDGNNIWIITYQSSPIEWRIAKLGSDGQILRSFVVPVHSYDDIHNLGMTNLASDRRTIWANHWNEGIIYRFNKRGKVLRTFGVPSVNQLIPVGITWDGKYLWVLHWSNKNLYKLTRRGKEIDKISLLNLMPTPDMGLVWDGEYFWVGNKGANRIFRITPDGKPSGYIKGPKQGGGIRDLAWDGEYLLIIYKQDNTIYKLKIID